MLAECDRWLRCEERQTTPRNHPRKIFQQFLRTPVDTRDSEASHCRWSVLELSHERGTRGTATRSETSTPPACSPKPRGSRWSPVEIEVRRLQLAYQWAVLHPATADTGVETPAGPGLGVLDADETLGGDGTPAVAAFAPESLATAMGWTPAAARNLMADALDLIHRHPRLLETSTPRPGPGLAGPPRRPADQAPPEGGCPVGRRPARRPDRLRPRRHRPARRPGRRPVRPRRTPTPRRRSHCLSRRRALAPGAGRVRRSQ